MNKAKLHTALASLYALSETITDQDDFEVVQTMTQRLTYLGQGKVIDKDAEPKPVKTKAEPKTTKAKAEPKQTKAKVEKKAEPKPEKSLRQVVAELPDGDGIPLKTPYIHLAHLGADKLKYYLAGRSAEMVIDKDLLAECAETGVQRDMVDAIFDAVDVQRKKVASVTLSEKDQKVIKKYQSAIDDGKALYDVMVVKGADKATLNDFMAVVKAVRG